ncbi:alpha/beta fold hydrolase [Streptomyces sp. NPDC091281]|uniref:alpha/beta fold hydrolase n=1 Tax=Streptomyces sp. NPDC091281 TaxID=3365985 RepID=UPI00382F52EB
MDIDGGRIAYESTGRGPLIVLSHGIGDLRQSYRFLAPLLAEAGYRVVSADLRGHGESSTGWPSISRSDVASDLIALIRHLGGPAVVVGQSLSGGAATIAAAQAPELVTAVVELNPFTRVPKTDVGAMLRVGRYRRGGLLMGATVGLRSLRMWLRYLDVAYPTKPADWAAYTELLRAKLSEPERMAQFLLTMKTDGSDAEAHLPRVTAPTLIVMGSADPDFPDPVAEGEAIVAALPAGIGTLKVVEGAGHYLHAETPAEVAALVTRFLADHADA